MTEYSRTKDIGLKGSLICYALAFCGSVMGFIDSAIVAFGDPSKSYWIIVFAVLAILCMLVFRETAQKLSTMHYKKEVDNE